MKCVVRGSQRQTVRITGSLIARQADNHLGGGGGGSPLRANDPSLTPQYGEQEEPHIS